MRVMEGGRGGRLSYQLLLMREREREMEMKHESRDV